MHARAPPATAAWRAALSPRLRTSRASCAGSPAHPPGRHRRCCRRGAAPGRAGGGPRRGRGRRGRPPSGRRRAGPRRNGRGGAGPRRGAGRGRPRPAPSPPARAPTCDPGGRSATSACWRIVATGERSSCDASDTNRCCRRCASSRRSSIRFIVSARRAISSRTAGAGRGGAARRRRSRPPRGGWPRPGRGPARSTNHAVRPTTRSSTGTPAARIPLEHGGGLDDVLEGASHEHAAARRVGDGGPEHEEVGLVAVFQLDAPVVVEGDLGERCGAGHTPGSPPPPGRRSSSSWRSSSSSSGTGAGRRPVAVDGVDDLLGAGLARLPHALGQRAAQEADHRDGADDERHARRRARRRRSCGSAPCRARATARPDPPRQPPSAASRYPAPRTVWIAARSKGRSTLLRRCRT